MREPPKKSRFHFVQLVGAFVVVLVPVVVACGSEDDTRYGGPEGLAGKRVAPISTATAAASGSSPSSCADAGPCTVSFTQTIWGKYMAASGTWKCSDSSCHGAGSSQEPSIDGTNAQAAYNSLTSYTQLQGEPYVAACSTDPSASAIDCNLKGSCSQMPQTGAGVNAAQPTTTELADLDAWLACGAPFN